MFDEDDFEIEDVVSIMFIGKYTIYETFVPLALSEKLTFLSPVDWHPLLHTAKSIVASWAELPSQLKLLNLRSTASCYL